MREIRRRIRAAGAFPDGQSCFHLVAARLRYIAGTACSSEHIPRLTDIALCKARQAETADIERRPAIHHKVGGNPANDWSHSEAMPAQTSGDNKPSRNVDLIQHRH